MSSSGAASGGAGRRVHWSYSDTSQFLVSSANELRLCEYTPNHAAAVGRSNSGRRHQAGRHGSAAPGGNHAGRQTVKTVAVTSDLPAFKSLAISPGPSSPDLVALGLLTGRTILLRIHDVPVYTSNPHPAIIHLNVRNPRPCNVVAFSPVEPTLLVTGYDKARDSSLLVWDTRDAIASSSATNTVARNSKQSPGPAAETRPIAQFGLSETVSAATFLHHAPRILVAAMATKWIRCYDLRQPSGSASSASQGQGNRDATAVLAGRNVVSLHADPFDSHRFASVAEDGLVRLWDLRFTNNEPLLTFCSDDGIVKPYTAPVAESGRRGGDGRSERSSTAGIGRSGSKISLPAVRAAADIAAGHAQGGSSATIGSTVTMSFSTTRRGLLATLDAESNHLSAWNIFEVGSGYVSIDRSQARRYSSSGGPSQAQIPSAGGALMLRSHSQDTESPIPTLYYERKTSDLPRIISSFAFVPGQGGPQQFVTVARDGTVDFCQVKESPQSAFDTSGQFAYSWENKYAVEGQNLAPPAVVVDVRSQSRRRPLRQHEPEAGRHVRNGPFGVSATLGKIDNLNSRQASPERISESTGHHRKDNGRSRSSNAQAKSSRRRPAHSDRESTNDDEDEHEYGYAGDDAATTEAEDDDLEAPPPTIPLLEKDISVIMRSRGQDGYGLDPVKNRRLVSKDKDRAGAARGTLHPQAELWSWIEHAASLSSGGRAFVDGYDFGFRGVLAILKGFSPHASSTTVSPSHSQDQSPRMRQGDSGPSSRASTIIDRPGYSSQSKRSRTVSQPASAANNQQGAVADDVRHVISKGDSARAQENAFARAASTLNRKNGNTPFSLGSGTKVAQRQLALASIGPDFATGDVQAVIRRYEAAGCPSKAAAWALFSGNVELAIKSLKNNKDEKLKLLAPILATHQAQKDQQGTSAFKELCAGLSTNLDDPFMRAIFAYLASGDWSDVLEEDALPLKDRVGVALRFLPDDELYRNLELMASKATSSGDLEGLLLTGLDASGFSLLGSYVDRTGDVQTAALASAFVHPGQTYDIRAERWIEAYRKLLDHWKLYIIRARFDIARGSKMRSSLAVKGTEESSAAIGALLAPPNMAIRCHYCNETVAPRTAHGGGSQINQPLKRRQGAPSQPVPSGRTTRCPNCSKSFPQCSICLESIEVSTTGNDATPAWCWCQRCRHGGHALHVLEWFRRGNSECPVADCDCNCQVAH